MAGIDPIDHLQAGNHMNLGYFILVIDENYWKIIFNRILSRYLKIMAVTDKTVT